MKFKDYIIEAIKTHPDLKEMLDIFKKKGYKAKVQYGELTIPFLKGVSEEEAVKKFFEIAPFKWEKTEREGIWKSGDLTVSFGEFSGKIFAGVNS